MEAIAAQSQRTPGTIGYHCWEDWKDANGFRCFLTQKGNPGITGFQAGF